VPEDGCSASHTHTRRHVPQDRDLDIHPCANLVPKVCNVTATFTDMSVGILANLETNFCHTSTMAELPSVVLLHITLLLCSVSITKNRTTKNFGKC